MLASDRGASNTEENGMAIPELDEEQRNQKRINDLEILNRNPKELDAPQLSLKDHIGEL